MTAFAKFVNHSKDEGFEAVIDQETGRWVATQSFIDQPELFNDHLNALAPAGGSYAAEEAENWYGDEAMVLRPIGWFRALRLKNYYPDGEVVVYFEDDGDRDLVY
jgi:hypothetical protein